MGQITFGDALIRLGLSREFLWRLIRDMLDGDDLDVRGVQLLASGELHTEGKVTISEDEIPRLMAHPDYAEGRRRTTSSWRHRLLMRVRETLDPKGLDPTFRERVMAHIEAMDVSGVYLGDPISPDTVARVVADIRRGK